MSALSVLKHASQDLDPTETSEWLDSLSAVLQHGGSVRASFLLAQLNAQGRRAGAVVDFSTTTDYVNSIPTDQQAVSPGDPVLEKRIHDIIRWNALAMVVRANRKPGDLGGHLASFASSATLYETGFNHFWRAPSESHPGDLIFTQGHSSPGIYARSFLEGRFEEAQLDLFRAEVEGDGHGLSSYPHPWLMPDYWQVATVSMGLGPLQAIYQAHFWRYLEQRRLMATSDRKVWAFLGDGEIDEPETVGALALAGRERLDNLIFVINCNLQRLDGPVRGNGKIIQEAESTFRGAGWNVIKLVWGSRWDSLLAQDEDGELRRVMMETVDGEYQAFKALGGAYAREHFFGKNESTRRLAETLSDAQIAALDRGGHDPVKVFAAYHAAFNAKGRPTVILAKTIKGYELGEGFQSQNTSHNKKKIDDSVLRELRDRLSIPIPDDRLGEVPYFHPGPESAEVKYMQARRAKLGGSLPRRRRRSTVQVTTPELQAFDALLQSSGDREISTTMALVRVINILLRDKQVGPRVVPIIADEARTFGIEGLFRQVGIYAPFGQTYTPNDSSQLVYYREETDGQVLQEGISEAGGISAWIAAGTSYSVNNVPMLPFFLYYAMFGFQRVGDLAWAAADMRTRGFLVGGTAGRTTINGEGLQHEDGHSHLMSGVIPNVVSYDPTFAYEVAVIVQDGVRRMMQEQEDVYFYLTVMNENYRHPAMLDGCEEGILRGMYLLAPAGGVANDVPRVQLLGAGTILREVLAAADMLSQDFGVAADVWSCPSFSELRRDGFQAERWNRLHPEEPERLPYVTSLLMDRPGPVIAASDYVRGVADQIRAFIPGGRRFTVLGTDGFGRSDTRANLRAYFEVDRRWVAHAALTALMRDGVVPRSVVANATALYGIDIDKAEPALG